MMSVCAAGQSRMDTFSFRSGFLNRMVLIRVLVPVPLIHKGRYPLLVLNDGQDLRSLRFRIILDSLVDGKAIPPILVVAVDAGNRLQEYGVCGHPDYMGRGARACQYSQFIRKELLPTVLRRYWVLFSTSFIAGWSLGGLSAMDIAWEHPMLFEGAGVFSGSLWWRSVALGPHYNDSDRIMEALVNHSRMNRGQRFWFEAGTADETSDRNHNGIIDAIEDTRDLISALKSKGYPTRALKYVEVPGGKHNQQTWSLVMPQFLNWAFGNIKWAGH